MIEAMKQMVKALENTLGFTGSRQIDSATRQAIRAGRQAIAEAEKQEPVAQFKSPGQRWEDGDDHDPRSEEIYKFIADVDFKHCGDSFCFKSGGDGDNGEKLMFILDCWFATRSSTPPASQKPLTDEQIEDLIRYRDLTIYEAFRLAEAAHNIKE